MRMSRIMVGIMRLICFLLAVSVLTGCERKKEVYGDSIFSWHSEEIHKESLAELTEVMKAANCSVLYQQIDYEEPPEMREEFYARMRQEEYRVYYLCGEPDWITADSMRYIEKAILETAALKTESDGVVCGLVFDVEPHTLAAWETEAAKLMDSYVETMLAAYQLAKKQELEMIVCIPSFYDKEYPEQLETLIAEGCDAIAVMNYTSRDHLDRVRTEAELAKKNQKQFIYISEVNAGEPQELAEQMTEIRFVWETVRSGLPEMELSFSWHHLDRLKEWMKGESKDE